MALIAILATVCAIPALASAGDLSFDGQRLHFVGSPGETNELSLKVATSTAGTNLQIHDTLQPINTTAPCLPMLAGHLQLCPIVPAIIDLGDMDDTVKGADGQIVEQLLGGAGDDDIFARSGTDTLDGGPGDDVLDPGPSGDGPDVLRGGDGRDSAAYFGDAPLQISLDGQSNDGASGDGDNVAADVEVIHGSTSADALTGGPGADELFGGNGDDRIAGVDGDDILRGGDGNDTLDGGAGHDTFEPDFCAPPLVSCVGNGNDLILARDGAAETIECFAGVDRAVVDALDQVAATCETVDRPSPPSPPSKPSLPSRTPDSFRFKVNARVKLATVVGRGIRTTLSCPAACTADVQLRVDARTARRYRFGRRIGRASAWLAAGQRKTVQLKMAPGAERRLGRGRGLRAVTVRVVFTNADGVTSVQSKRLRVSR